MYDQIVDHIRSSRSVFFINHCFSDPKKKHSQFAPVTTTPLPSPWESLTVLARGLWPSALPLVFRLAANHPNGTSEKWMVNIMKIIKWWSLYEFMALRYWIYHIETIWTIHFGAGFLDAFDLYTHMDPYGRMVLVVKTCGTLPKEHPWNFKSN